MTPNDQARLVAILRDAEILNIQRIDHSAAPGHREGKPRYIEIDHCGILHDQFNHDYTGEVYLPDAEVSFFLDHAEGGQIILHHGQLTYSITPLYRRLDR